MGNCFWNGRLTASCPIYAPDAIKLNSLFELSDLKSCPSIYIPNANDVQQCFYNCSNLKSFNGFVDSHNVNNMWRTFCNCGSLTSVGWFDTYNLENMSETFSGCTKLTKVPHYNTVNVSSMDRAFHKCYKLTGVPDFDVSNLVKMSQTFEYCSGMKTLPKLNFTENITACDYAFRDCVNVSSNIYYDYYKLKQWNPPTYNYCFYKCGVSSTVGSAEYMKVPSVPYISDRWR